MEGQKQAERREKEQERKCDRTIREGEMVKEAERRREIANREHPPGQLGGLGLHEELHPE